MNAANRTANPGKLLVKTLLRELSRVGVVTLLTVATALLQFVAGIIVARSLGPDGRGLVTIVVAVAGLASIASAFGTGVAFRRMFPHGEANVRGFFRITLLLAVVLGIPITIISIFGVGMLVDSSVYKTELSLLFLVFGVTNILWLQGKEGLAAIGQVQYGAVIGAVGSVAFLLYSAGITLIYGGKVSEILAGYVLMNLIQTAMAWLRMRKGTRNSTSVGARRLLRAGPPYLAYILGQESVLRLDRALIGIFSSSSAAGLFAVGAGLAEVLRLPVLASSQFVLLDTASGRLMISGVLKRVVLWSGIVLLFVAFLWPLAPIVIPFLYGEEFTRAIGPFRVLLIAQLCLVPFLIVSRAMVGLGNRWLVSLPSVLGLVVLLIAAPILVSDYAAVGGALACVAAYLTMSVSSIVTILIKARNLRSRVRKII